MGPLLSPSTWYHI